MTNAKLEIIDKKLAKLKEQRNKIELKEKVKSRKLLNKQKILVGGYWINKIKSMDTERKETMKSNILKTIKNTRQNDIEAIEKLFSEVNNG